MTSTLSLSAQRTLVAFLAIALALGTLLPLVAPGPAAAASANIVISEFRTRGPNGAADEFIELHNRSAAPVPIGGWAVRRSNDTGGNFTQLTIADGTSIGSGCFFLIANSSGYSGAVTADATYAIGIMDQGGIGVESTLGLVDAVGMSTGSFYKEGTTLAPLTANTNQGYERKPGGTLGHADTDDSAADFQVLAPSNPQNSSSSCLEVGDSVPPTGVGTADPATVDPGGSTLLSVTVTPGTRPFITVTGDLSSIGYSTAEAFADADLDNVFTFTADIPADAAPGARSLPITIADDEGGSSTTSIALTVTAPPTQIWQIQGESHISPLARQQVFDIEGVVTATPNGVRFWMSDPTPDDNPNTSDGIFVFRSSAPAGTLVNVGDLVSVDGTVAEFRPGFAAGFENLTTTQIGSPTVTIVSSDHALPTTVIGVDRIPPTLVIDDDSTTSVEADDALYDPETDGIDFWESLEGMRLQVADAVATGPTNGFGEISVISQLQADAGIRTPRGGLLVRKLGEAGDYQPGDFNPERVILDDVLANTPDLNTGDEFATDPVGVLDYSFGNFKLLVTADPGRDDNELAREAAALPGPHELKVATFNVENLSPLDTDEKVEALASQIVDNLRSPDLIAIEEMQDNSGDTDDVPDGDDGVVAADLSWQRLIAAIVAAGGPLYDYRQIDPVDNADGGVPGGNIRVGFLFHSERGLEFVDRPGGDAVTDTDVDATPSGKGAQLTISPGRVLDAAIGGEDSFELTRKSLAGEFRFRGETIFVIANHFSSKGDDRPLFGHFQPPFRLTEFESLTTPPPPETPTEDGWRHAQAQAINDFVDEIRSVDADAHVIVLGDINDFDFSETVEIITGERVALDPGPFMPDPEDGSGQTAETGIAPIMHTLFDRVLPENERYSYVFDGNSQVLDQIIVSESLWSLGASYDVVHVNAEFFDQASDHDPSVMTVAFQPRSGVTSSVARGR